MYRHATLSNNLRIVSHDLKDRDSAAIGIMLGAGGRFEEDRIKGAAHFLEHIVFKGSKKYGCSQIKEQIEGVGGSLNAFTSEERTCFYAKVPAKHVERAFDVLADMVLCPLIRPKDIEKERTVISEEIKMYHDLPQYLVMDLLDSIMWPDHPLGKSLAGTIESVGAMRAQDLQSFHQRHYLSGNTIVSGCGHIQHEQLLALTKKLFKRIPQGLPQTCLAADNSQITPRAKFYRKNTEQMHVSLGMLGLKEGHADKYALNLLHIILGGNMSSRLFNELREKKGLAYSISTGVKPLSDTGLFVVRAGVDNHKLLDAIELILKELDKIKTKGVAPAEFNRAKEYYLGQVLLGMEDTLEHMLWLADTLMARNHLETLKDIVRQVSAVTLPDIRRVARQILRQDRFNLAIVGPLNDEQEQKMRHLLQISE